MSLLKKSQDHNAATAVQNSTEVHVKAQLQQAQDMLLQGMPLEYGCCQDLSLTARALRWILLILTAHGTKVG